MPCLVASLYYHYTIQFKVVLIPQWLLCICDCGVLLFVTYLGIRPLTKCHILHVQGLRVYILGEPLLIML